jgi:RNA polymerase sigma-70 factor, ECF subfamily
MTAAIDIEADFLSRLRAGDKEAFAVFVRENTGKMLAVARNLLHSEEDAADAVQDAFLSAFRSLDHFQGNSSLATWLHRITINTGLMKLRHRSRHKTCSIDNLLPQFDETGHHRQAIRPWSARADDPASAEETKTLVRACIERLPDGFRTVLVLRDIEGIDTEQTAALLGMNCGAVKTRLHRARLALRTLLEPYMQDGAWE